MNGITSRAELSKELLLFLQQRGYSHILSIGATETEFGPEGGRDEYKLLPLKLDDPRLVYEETDYIISPIMSQEVNEMAEGVDFICFMIDVPVEDYEYYIKLS